MKKAKQLILTETFGKAIEAIKGLLGGLLPRPEPVPVPVRPRRMQGQH